MEGKCRGLQEDDRGSQSPAPVPDAIAAASSHHSPPSASGPFPLTLKQSSLLPAQGLCAGCCSSHCPDQKLCRSASSWLLSTAHCRPHENRVIACFTDWHPQHLAKYLARAKCPVNTCRVNKGQTSHGHSVFQLVFLLSGTTAVKLLTNTSFFPWPIISLGQISRS